MAFYGSYKPQTEYEKQIHSVATAWSTINAILAFDKWVNLNGGIDTEMSIRTINFPLIYKWSLLRLIRNYPYQNFEGEADLQFQLDDVWTPNCEREHIKFLLESNQERNNRLNKSTVYAKLNEEWPPTFSINVDIYAKYMKFLQEGDLSK